MSSTRWATLRMGASGSTSRVPLRDETGQVAGVVGLTRDVTEAKRARIEVEEQRHLLRSVIDTIPDFITVKDREGRCITRNIADARVIGYDTVEETIGLTIFDTDQALDQAVDYHADDVRVMETGEPVLAKEFERQFGGGWKEITKMPLRDLEGEVIGLVSIMRDVTDRKESEIRLRRAKRAAEDAKEAAEAREAEVAEQRRVAPNGDRHDPRSHLRQGRRGPGHTPKPRECPRARLREPGRVRRPQGRRRRSRVRGRLQRGRPVRRRDGYRDPRQGRAVRRPVAADHQGPASTARRRGRRVGRACPGTSRSQKASAAALEAAKDEAEGAGAPGAHGDRTRSQT